MKILLVYANGVSGGYLPVGLAMISAVLKKAGHTVFLFDTSFLNSGRFQEREVREKYLEYRKITDSDEAILKNDKGKILDKFKEIIQKNKPDLIGISSSSTEFFFIKPFLKKIKASFDIPILIGGPHATVCPEKTIKERCVDMICVGEGEGAIVELCDKLQNNEDITKVRNVWVKKGGKIYRNPVRPLISDLDSLPFPDWKLFDIRHFRRPFRGSVKKYGFFELGRGCPFACTYCINKYLQELYRGKGKYHREKSVKRIIDEMVTFKKIFGLEHVQFIDDTFLAMTKEKLREFASLYKKKIGATFFATTRPETIDKEIVNILKDMNCAMVSLGIETGNEKFRRKICKRYMKNSVIINAYKLLKEGGLKTMSYNLIGMPHETRKLIFDTIKLNRKIKPNSFSLKFLAPFEGTEIRQMCIDAGYINKDSDIDKLVFEGSILKMPQISENELRGLRKTFILYVYLPYIMWPLIRICEKENFISNKLYPLLSKIYHNWYAH